MSALRRFWAWLVLNWRYDTCSVCGAQTVPKHDDRSYSAYPTCRRCDPDLWAEPLTDAHRLAVVRELWSLHNASGRVHMDQTLTEFERQVKERLEP